MSMQNFDFDNYEYQRFVDPSTEEISEATAEGFKVVLTERQPGFKPSEDGASMVEHRVVTVMMRRSNA